MVEPNDLRATSPFVLLVEDFIDPQGDFHEHPRVIARGLFVAGCEAELAGDFADLHADRIVENAASATDA